MLKMSLKEFIFPLIKSMDEYNYLLKSHHRRVAVIAYAIGKQMKLSEKELVDLVIAASLHDIGILNVQNRDQLLEADVSDPKPHCEMGYEILNNCQALRNVANIIRYHHVFYNELYTYADEVKIQSHIIHVADRIDIYIDRSEPLLEQREYVRTEISDRKGTLMHPKVCGAFEIISRDVEFWLDIKNMSLEQLFSQLEFTDEGIVTEEMVKSFSLVMSRIVDFRSQYTAGHSLTVGNIAQFIGTTFQENISNNAQFLVAGLLHDIGKIHINPELLDKETALEQDELNQLRLIPRYSKEILSDLSSSPWFKNVVLWISEYDNQKSNTQKEDEQQIGASILELSHIITALMEQRSYRDAYNIDEAIKILQEGIASKSELRVLKFIIEHKTEIHDLITKYQSEGLNFYENIETEFDYL